MSAHDIAMDPKPVAAAADGNGIGFIFGFSEKPMSRALRKILGFERLSCVERP